MAPEVRISVPENEPMGVVSLAEALRLAGEMDVDLIETVATANPPVCRLMDYGKFKFQEQKKAAEAKSKQKVIEAKEIKFRPKVDEHDYQFKKKHIERFLAEGDKVKATVFFRGREIAHPEIGRRILERLVAELTDQAIAETLPRLEGNQMGTILTQRPCRKVEKAPATSRAGATGAVSLAGAKAAAEHEQDQA